MLFVDYEVSLLAAPHQITPKNKQESWLQLVDQ